MRSGPDSRIAAKKWRSCTLTGFNGEPVIYFFGSSNSKKEKRGGGYGGGTRATGVCDPDYEERPSNILETQEMGWAAV